MAARRQAVITSDKKTKKKSWIKNILSIIKIRQMIYIAIFILVVAGVVVGYERFGQMDILPIETVEIEGEFKYLLTDDLKRYALPKINGGFFSVKLEAIRESLLLLPWVEDVSIHRQWPQALRLRVMEKQPVAYWGDQGYVSAKGELFEPEVINKELGLPLLVGLDGQHTLMLKELSGMQLLIAELGMHVLKIKQDARRSWTLVLSSGIELRLGRNNIYERLQRFVDVFDQHLKKQESKIKYIDMRYTNGFAVAFDDQVTQSRGA
ncbi:MAG: cell division protein FtsQ/DivIB [Gammaproteobacteria bacterium]|nr:cell division protein FtsQ/DivIB [Gammaproteobacteria bacterium]MDH5734838.1 cell division protein FtsQ/DivIB [Gammaproteobacteria bacterium]